MDTILEKKSTSTVEIIDDNPPFGYRKLSRYNKTGRTQIRMILRENNLYLLHVMLRTKLKTDYPKKFCFVVCHT